MPPLAAAFEARPFHILLVEDSPPNRAILQAYLKKTPYRIDLADCGEIAVAKFMEQRYDLVLMDVVMPGMGGYTATELMRGWETKQGFRRTPIIALTAHDREEDRRKSFASGCDGHVTKPVSRKTLLETIKKYEGGSFMQRQCENAIVVHTDKNLADLVPGYLDNRRKDIPSMTQALKRGDYDMIKILAHSMKGSGGAYGFDAISDIGNALEQAAKHKDAEETAQWISELSVYLARLKIVYVEPDHDFGGTRSRLHRGLM